MIFNNLPIEIWQVIIDKLYSKIDMFCLKLTCKFFYNLINDINGLHLNKSLTHYLIRIHDSPSQFNWFANRYNYRFKYRDLTSILATYANIYLKPEFKDVYFIEFRSIDHDFEITTPIKKKSRMGHYLLHKGIVK